MNKPLISTHTFMLPIRWDYKENSKYFGDSNSSNNFDDRTNLLKMNEFLIDSNWKRKFYKLENNEERYNEITYFHAYATKTMFDLQQKDEKDEYDVSNKKVMTYYELPIEKDPESYFEIEVQSKEEPYKLNLKDICLHVYATGVAILVFHLENDTYSKIDDILQINEKGRKIYPAFLGKDGLRTTATKNAFLPLKITIYSSFINDGIPIVEDFKSYDSLINKETHQYQNNSYCLNEIVEFPKYVTKLFNEKFVFNLKNETEHNQIIRMRLLGDDRMFLQCIYGNNTFSNFLCRSKNKPDQYYEYEKNKSWYAYMNGDGSEIYPTIQHQKMLRDEIEKSTYQRWTEFTTLFGFTRDSFVCVCSNIDQLSLPLDKHMKTIYYQMAILSLAQRSSVLRFSSEISNLADLGKTNESEATKQIEKLYLNYIEFINKIYYREVTPTIQGIEMYNQFQKVMGIQQDTNSLKEEIQELFNFAEMIRSERLTSIATYFAPFSIVFGILGANFLNDKFFNDNYFMWFSIAIIISLLLGYVANNYFNHNFKNYKNHK